MVAVSSSYGKDVCVFFLCSEKLQLKFNIPLLSVRLQTVISMR